MQRKKEPDSRPKKPKNPFKTNALARLGNTGGMLKKTKKSSY
jgi:hypothetical protein